MATSETIPTKASDLVLFKMQRKQFARLVTMWRRCETGLDFYTWCAQKLENMVIDDLNAQKVDGLNREERPTRPTLPVSRGRGHPQLSKAEREQVKAAIVSGMLRPNSPIALLAAAEEES
jgi:hypothetical protein